ncbi:DUF5679 domain-containing protein [Roseiflexus sp.]|uniref:DUF5679 domain-containing protein n=1 Tax=Roseiflexus sp. TaxID=2562120 RepID=UPI0021DC5AF3|nr:DUF5679 domain-containing protein [Roseiflexus sp.]GIV99179.1 MAG: hypothetical protein KatS3mg058_0583 [Roseiflexus sp.]
MPVPPGLLMDIAILIVREYRRSRKRRAAPGVARAPAPLRAPARRLSSVGRALRLAVIVGLLWLLWREVTRRRAALIEARRDAFSRAASMTVVSPAPSLPPASPAPAPGDADSSVSPVDSAEHARSKTSAENLASPEHAAPEDATADEERGNGVLIGWCARCRVRQPMQRVTFETNAGGRSIARGVCPVCGAGITRFVAREARKIEG